MRWDRLFDDLEAQSAELELEERDALADELRDGDWAQTSWRQLLGGRVVVVVCGAGRLEGDVVLVNEHLVQLRGDRLDHVVSAASVLAVESSERRADPPTPVASGWGWSHVFRALRDAGDEVRLWLVDGTTRDGVVTVAGHDFVRLAVGAGREQVVPHDAIAVVSGRT